MNKYRTAWPRVAAAIIDGLILWPLSLIFAFFLALGGESRVAIVLSALLSGFVPVFYYIWMHGKYGQTLGKMAVKVKVVDEREKPINFNHAIMRSLPQLIPAMHAAAFAGENAETKPLGLVLGVLLGAFFLMDALFFLCTDRHRALHDLIAKTVVVKTKP